MKAKIDLEKFICSYIKWNNIQDALKDQGLKCCNGKIVKISQESEDEKIIKALLEYFAEECDTSTISGIYCHKIYDWLKKQSEQKLIGNIKPKFNVGDWVVYNRNDSSMEILYIYDIRDGRYYFNDNIHFSWSVKECNEKCHIWTIADAKDGDVLLSKYNQPFIYNGIFDEENVGAYCGIDKLGNDFLIDPFSCDWSYKEGVKPATKEQRDFLFSKIKEAGYEWNEKKKELKKITQKSIVNIESKFYEGDWIIYNNDICQIVKREEGCNKLVTVFGIEKELVNERNLSTARLWTIQDAKDGDVLVNGSNIFIFHFINDTRLMGYCHINIDDRRFYDDLGKNECFCLIDAVVTPATKEQRDFLMKAMADAGYTFDFNKKELNKIEKQSLKPKWGEEDTFKVQRISKYLNESKKYYADITEVRECLDWLKSIKERIGE